MRSSSGWWNTALEGWRLTWTSSSFVVALTPTVLKEIDLHKTDERRFSRREKAERFARLIREYRRRSLLLRGVTQAAGIGPVMAIAVEPKMSEWLPSLDAGSPEIRYWPRLWKYYASIRMPPSW